MYLTFVFQKPFEVKLDLPLKFMRYEHYNNEKHLRDAQIWLNYGLILTNPQEILTHLKYHISYIVLYK